MREKDIKDILKSKFQLVEDKYFPDQWKSLLSLFFKKIDYFSHPENIFPDDDKVVDGKQIGTIKLSDVFSFVNFYNLNLLAPINPNY